MKGNPWLKAQVDLALKVAAATSVAAYTLAALVSLRSRSHHVSASKKHN